MSVPTKQTITRMVSRELPGRRFIIATVGLQYLEGNRDAYWTAMADVYEPHGTWSGRARFNHDREPDMFGACHEEILSAWPWLAPIVSLHLADSDGVPMYAVENGRYHLARDPQVAAKLWRCSVDDLPALEDVDSFVEAQRDRWRAEAELAWDTLKGLGA